MCYNTYRFKDRLPRIALKPIKCIKYLEEHHDPFNQFNPNEKLRLISSVIGFKYKQNKLYFKPFWGLYYLLIGHICLKKVNYGYHSLIVNDRYTFDGYPYICIIPRFSIYFKNEGRNVMVSNMIIIKEKYEEY